MLDETGVRGIDFLIEKTHILLKRIPYYIRAPMQIRYPYFLTGYLRAFIKNIQLFRIRFAECSAYKTEADRPNGMRLDRCKS